MNKIELIDTIAAKTGVEKKTIETVIESCLETITTTLKTGGEITFTGFGTFMARVRAARLGVNPRKPDEKIQIPEVLVPKFRAGKALKDALKSSSSPTPPPPAPAATPISSPQVTPTPQPLPPQAPSSPVAPVATPTSPTSPTSLPPVS